MTALDEALTRKVAELLDRLESYLPKTLGVMTWVYNRDGADLDVVTFASHETTAETLRIVRATASKLVAQESKQGAAGDERYFVVPLGGAPSDHLISSAAVSRSGAHDRVRLWSRGGLAGELVVTAGDGERVAMAHGLVRAGGGMSAEPFELPADGSREGAIYYRALSDGNDITLYAMIGSWKLCCSRQGSLGIDRWYEYTAFARAFAAAPAWDGKGEPLAGWVRSSERRP